MARRSAFLTILLAFLVGPAMAARESSTAREMREAATAFLSTLDESQRTMATFPFDAEERFNWHFVPRERKGIPLKALSPAQQDAALRLLKASLSAKGFEKAEGVRSLEPILFELEKGRPDRDAGRYFVSVFGAPASDKPWGWRYEGHHLSQNWTIVGGASVSSSPQFFGANPAEIRSGPRAGTRVLAHEEDLARTVVTSLDEAQRRQAIVSPEAPRDILSTNQRQTGALDTAGIAWTSLTAGQQKLLLRLIEEYAFAQAAQVGADRMARVRKGGLDRIWFAWLGSMEKGAAHYYRVQGPQFLIEYDNTQNDANHIHSVWRDFTNDFGRDLLAEHYRTDPDHQAIARHAALK